MPRIQAKDENTIQVITVTLDTNVLVAYWKEEDNALVAESLLNLAQQGKIDLAITSRINADIPRPSLADRINELPDLKVQQIGAPFRFGHSSWDEGDVWGSDVFIEVVTSLEEEPNQAGRQKRDWRDWDHLQGHYLRRREFFLTWDDGILVLASKLREKLGIVAMKPEEFLASVFKPTRNGQL